MSGHSKNPVLAGQKFGMLTTLSDAGRSNDGHRLWLCACECGGTTTKSTNNLRGKRIQNCGCFGLEVQIESHKTHGMRFSRTYSSWLAAKNRCHTPTSKDYERYGARGISMCQAWRDSFETFLADMGERPDGTSLDRYPDSEGNYEPGNARWATPIEQARNKKSAIWFAWKGKETALADIAQELGISYGATFQRMKRGKLHEPA